jgi:hypothetical protein
MLTEKKSSQRSQATKSAVKILTGRLKGRWKKPSYNLYAGFLVFLFLCLVAIKRGIVHLE